mgnify:CR=1 FL=1
MTPLRRTLIALAASAAALVGAGFGTAAHAAAHRPAAPVPAVATTQSDYGICVGNAPVWFLNFCAI